MELTRRTLLATAAGLPAAAALSAAPAAKPKLQRKDSFLGMHFDLHPSPRDTALGRDVTEEMVDRFLDKVKPDYVQYDYKGHVGYVGYPSKVSASAPVVKDSLRIWRDVTARRGVALYIHFSGVLDGRAVQDHPEWARVGPDGKAHPQQTSTFGPYVDERLIPQLKEAIENYDIDGVWVDGECWGTNPDYSPMAVEAYRQVMGGADPPKGPADKGWLEFLEFHRQQFRKYVKHYADVLHGFRPSFQVTSNWLYSSFVPEKPELPVDFLSGDYLGNASISTARLDARYLAMTGKPWDLMAWGFHDGRQSPIGPSHKPAVQLQQEAAVVLAQGGGFQVYYQPTRAGWLDDRHVEVMGKVAAFCRARQTLSHATLPVPQIGLLFSKRSLYNTANKLFGGWGAAANPARGLLDALVENHYSVDVIPDWKLDEVARQYPLIVLPDWTDIGAEVKNMLSTYVKGGGKLLITGAENAALFAGELGVKLVGAPRRQQAYLPGEEVFGNARGVWQDVEPAGARVVEQRYPAYDARRDGVCAATVSKVGAGEIAAVYGPLGTVFAQLHAPATRQFIGRLVARVFRPAVKVDGPPTIEVALRKKDGKTLLHLANATAMQVATDYAALDFVPAVGPLKVRMQLPRNPTRVTLEPEGRAWAGEWRNGIWSGTVDRLHIHGIVAFEA